MFKAFGIGAILMLCFLTAGHMDYADALETDAAEKMARVERALRESPPTRESWALLHPLSCAGYWIKNCPDFKPCKKTCIVEKQ